MYRILFVCSANMIRSPLAEALLKKAIAGSDFEAEWQVESAGTWTRSGYPAHPWAASVASEMGIDLSQHTSRQVSKDILSGCDLILVMEDNHRQALRAEFPELSNRIALLSELGGNSGNIPDPVNSNLDAVRKLARDLNSVIEQYYQDIPSLIAKRKFPATDY